MTEYVVLKAVVDEGSEPVYMPLRGTVIAQNDIAAIKAKAKADSVDLSNGAVAVPKRNWRPRKPERKVSETTLWT